jgi:hypothetical protein
MEKTSKTCSTHSSQNNYNKNSCCKNKTISLSLTDTVSDGIFQWYTILNFIPTPIGNPHQNIHPKESNKWVVFEDPPDVKHPIRALYQVFVI